MSGGHFDYIQHRFNDVAEEIKNLIDTNDDTTEDEYGTPKGYQFSEETIKKFKEAYTTVSRAAKMVQRIDWLVCSDDSEDSFNDRWHQELDNLINY